MTRSGPERLCPSSGTALNRGPLMFWRSCCVLGIQAADLDVAYRWPESRGRAT
jgi:hypothetical protein